MTAIQVRHKCLRKAALASTLSFVFFTISIPAGENGRMNVVTGLRRKSEKKAEKNGSNRAALAMQCFSFDVCWNLSQT